LRHYELVTILSPMLNQDEASAKWDEIKSYIVNRDGEITAEQVWGTRRLAYPIRKGNYNFLEGSYYLSTFTVDSSFNRDLENYLRLDEQVLRSLILNCDGPLPDKPPPGPLTAPSRYIPPGRGRRQDGGGPIPDAPGGFGDRRQGGGPPPAAGAPAAPAPGTAAPAAPGTDAPTATPASAPVSAPESAEPTPAPESTADAPTAPEPAAAAEPTASAEPTATEPAPAPEPPAAAEPTASAEPTATEPAPAPEPTAAAEPTASAESTATEPAPAPEPPTETDGDAEA